MFWVYMTVCAILSGHRSCVERTSVSFCWHSPQPLSMLGGDMDSGFPCCHLACYSASLRMRHLHGATGLAAVRLPPFRWLPGPFMCIKVAFSSTSNGCFLLLLRPRDIVAAAAHACAAASTSCCDAVAGWRLLLLRRAVTSIPCQDQSRVRYGAIPHGLPQVWARLPAST